MVPKKDILLSFIISSRNDNYGGNALERLENTISGLAISAKTAGVLNKVELIVSDWGSDVPLYSVLKLNPEGAKITRFITIPKTIVKEVSQDAPFAEVFPNNVAIRAAKGAYIGRIDQDTIVGLSFLKSFFAMFSSQMEELEKSLFFSRRRSIPLPIVTSSWPTEHLMAFLHDQCRWFPIEGRMQTPWFDAPVGILLMHKSLWEACKGYNESLIYWGYMDAEICLRIQLKYQVVDLEKSIGCHFYHQRHSHFSLTKTPRRKNKRTIPKQLIVNDDHWGLHAYEFHTANTIGIRILPGTKKKRPYSQFQLILLLLRENLWEALLTTLRAILKFFRLHPFKLDYFFRGK